MTSLSSIQKVEKQCPGLCHKPVVRAPLGGNSMPLPDINEVAGDCRRRRHRGRDGMGAAPKTLPALKIAVRGRGAALVGRETVGVHGEAH